MGKNKRKVDRTEIAIVRKLVRSNVRNKKLEISDKEITYFANHPHEIDNLTSTMATKKVYIVIAVLIGVVFVAIALYFDSHRIFEEGLLNKLFTDLLFEGGVALWGASLTVYLLEIVMHRQEMINRRYRLEVQKKVDKYMSNKEGQ